jgi:hypothetical protein
MSFALTSPTTFSKALRRLAPLCAALLLSACPEPGPAAAPDWSTREDGPVAVKTERIPLHPFAHHDGCEQVMHPCRYEEACTAPCRGGAGKCCEGQWVCPTGFRGALAQKGTATRGAKREPRLKHGVPEPRPTPPAPKLRGALE